jgi:hypothetical protein
MSPSAIPFRRFVAGNAPCSIAGHHDRLDVPVSTILGGSMRLGSRQSRCVAKTGLAVQSLVALVDEPMRAVFTSV